MKIFLRWSPLSTVYSEPPQDQEKAGKVPGENNTSYHGCLRA